MFKIFVSAFFILSILQCSAPQKKEEIKTEKIEEKIIKEKEPIKPPEPKDPFDIYSKKENTNLKKKDTLGTLTIPIYSTQSALVTYDSADDANISINIGSEANVNCVYSKDDYVVGTYLKSLTKKLSSSKAVATYRIRSYNTSLINKFPTIFFLYEYITKDNLYGNLKIMVTNRTARGSLICAHDEPGYIKTFQKVVKSILDSKPVSMQFTVPGKYKHNLIYLVYLNDTPIGYTESYTFSQGADHLLSVSNELIILAPSGTELMTNEMKITISSDAITGETLDYKIVSFQNGKKRADLSLRKKGTKKYKVKGVFLGKSIDKTLTSEYKVIDSGNAISLFIKQHIRKKIEKYNYSEFNHSKPNTLSKAELIYMQKENSLHRIKYRTIQNFSMNIITDNNSPTEMNFQLGEKSFQYKRVLNEMK